MLINGESVPNTLSPESLRKIDAYWRAANSGNRPLGNLVAIQQVPGRRH
jgi:hypothetical protein